MSAAKGTAFGMAVVSLLAVAAGCASAPKPQAGLYAQIKNDNAADATILGCPDVCDAQGVKIVGGGADAGWNEPRIGVAYTIIVNGAESACPPVIPKTKYNHGVYFVIDTAGKCELGTRPPGENTPL
jgi:hypothetical protein